MTRRRFIVTTGLVVGTAGLAGCVGDGDDEPANGGAGNGDDENGDDANGDDTDLPPEPDLDRVDMPPHEPERPPEPEPGDEDEWDAKWLGDGMDEEPSLTFEHATAVSPAERELESPPSGDEEQRGSYAVTLIDSEETLTARINDPEELDVSFDEEVVLQIESGWGSSSVSHRFQRVEEHESGVYIHGYYTAPITQTTDVTSRHSVVIVEKPADEVELAHVSLTAGEDRRVNFDSSEGVVSGK